MYQLQTLHGNQIIKNHSMITNNELGWILEEMGMAHFEVTVWRQ
jgi:hypothetical protein